MKRTIEFPDKSVIGMTRMTDAEMESMSTDDIDVVDAWLGDKENSQVAGCLTGYARLKEPCKKDGESYEYLHFFMCVKNPCGLTNDVQNIELCRVKDICGHFILENTNRAYGAEGFWKHTPTKTLEGDDLKCRMFIRSLKAASKKLGFPKRVLPAIKSTMEDPEQSEGMVSGADPERGMPEAEPDVEMEK